MYYRRYDGLAGVAQRTVKYCWDTTKPYVEVVLGPDGAVYKLDFQVRDLI